MFSRDATLTSTSLCGSWLLLLGISFVVGPFIKQSETCFTARRSIQGVTSTCTCNCTCCWLHALPVTCNAALLDRFPAAFSAVHVYIPAFPREHRFRTRTATPFLKDVPLECIFSPTWQDGYTHILTGVDYDHSFAFNGLFWVWCDSPLCSQEMVRGWLPVITPWNVASLPSQTAQSWRGSVKRGEDGACTRVCLASSQEIRSEGQWIRFSNTLHLIANCVPRCFLSTGPRMNILSWCSDRRTLGGFHWCMFVAKVNVVWYHLRQKRLFPPVPLSGGWFVCEQDYTKIIGRIPMELGGRMQCGTGKSPFNFYADPGFFHMCWALVGVCTLLASTNRKL